MNFLPQYLKLRLVVLWVPRPLSLEDRDGEQVEVPIIQG